MDQDLEIAKKCHGIRAAKDFIKACKTGGMSAKVLEKLDAGITLLGYEILTGTPEELAEIRSIIKGEVLRPDQKSSSHDPPRKDEIPRSVVDLRMITWDDFYRLAEKMDLLKITEVCAFDGWDPLPTRFKFESDGKVTLSTVMGVVAAWVQRSLTEKKKLQKVSSEGKKRMEELLRAISSIGGSNTVSLTRFMACYPDALFYYRCYLIKKGQLRTLSGQQNVTFKIPGAIAFLNFGTIYNTVYWKTQFDALSRFYNPNFPQNPSIAEMIEKKRPEWNAKVISIASISRALRKAYDVEGSKCAKHHPSESNIKSDNSWGIFAHDGNVCGSCIAEAMMKEGTLDNDAGLTGFIITAPSI